MPQTLRDDPSLGEIVFLSSPLLALLDSCLPSQPTMSSLLSFSFFLSRLSLILPDRDLYPSSIDDFNRSSGSPRKPHVRRGHALEAKYTLCERRAFLVTEKAHGRNTFMLLGGLLGCSNTALILVKIGDSVELASCRLNIIPDLASLGRGALGTDEVVDAGLEQGKSILDMNALGEAGAQERGVDSEKDPGATLEQNHAEDQAQPQHDLKARNHRHG
mgnify:CR=1 FL=1